MKKIVISLVVVAFAAILISSAYAASPIVQQVTGGGWFISICSGNKCTFGFNAQENPEGELKGNVEFVDHGPVDGFDKGFPHVHGYEITALTVTETTATIEGECRLNGYPGPFPFIVYVEDNGEPGTYDWFRIQIYNLPAELGLWDNYYGAQGELGFPDNGGGNIQTHVWV